MAGEQYRRLTARVPDDLMMRIELADFLKRQGQNQPAIAAYQEALGYPALGRSVRGGLRLRVGGARP